MTRCLLARVGHEVQREQQFSFELLQRTCELDGLGVQTARNLRQLCRFRSNIVVPLSEMRAPHAPDDIDALTDNCLSHRVCTDNRLETRGTVHFRRKR